MENKYRKILQRAFKVISPDFDPSTWSDQEFQNVFVNDINFLLDHMMRRSKYIDEIKAKTTHVAQDMYAAAPQLNALFEENEKARIEHEAING